MTDTNKSTETNDTETTDDAPKFDHEKNNYVAAIGIKKERFVELKRACETNGCTRFSEETEWLLDQDWTELEKIAIAMKIGQSYTEPAGRISGISLVIGE